MAGRMVRIDEAIYEKLQSYESETGVPIARAVNEAVGSFVECIIPPRLEFIRGQRASQNETASAS